MVDHKKRGVEVWAIFEISRGVEEFSGSRGMRIYGCWQIFRIQGGWPMSDNDNFQGGSDPQGHYAIGNISETAISGTESDLGHH